MGIIRQGVLGGFRNKTGAVVGSYWRTLDVIKGMPRNTGKAPSLKQKNQQLQFALITSFLSWFGNLINVGFRSVSKVTTPMNVAVRYHLAEAVLGVAPNYAIDFSKVKFSVGKLDKPKDFGVESVAGAKLKFTWTNSYGNTPFRDGTDMGSFLVYNPAKKEFVTVENVIARSALSFTLQMPADFADDDVYAYMSFNSVIKEHLTSESVCKGPVPVIA